MIDRQSIELIINHAIDELVKNDRYLLEKNAREESVSAQLAEYIHKSELVVEPLRVTTEYDRHGDAIKQLLLPILNRPNGDWSARNVRPDIIVHEPGNDKNNLLVLEVKKPNRSLDFDRIKLEAYRSQLNYVYAAHVVLGMKSGTVVRRIIWVERDSDSVGSNRVKPWSRDSSE